MDGSFAYLPSDKELEALKENMISRRIWGGDFTADVLYNADGRPGFVLGVTDRGYIVLQRGTYVFHEGGQGNPYDSHMEEKKYYGGPLHYYAESGSPQNFYGTCQKTRCGEEPSASDNAVRVMNSLTHIRQLAFGYNASKSSFKNTCSAVAAGIALNYIAREFNSSIVPDGMKAELYSSVPGSDSQMEAYYPKAHGMQDYLVNTCGMGAASFSVFISSSVNKYAKNICPNSGLRMTSTPLPKKATIKRYIDNSIPVLITTTVTNNPKYNWHTMCVYGYRNINGVMELLVHTGWHGKDESAVSDGVRVQNEMWISKRCATFGYYFSFY